MSVLMKSLADIRGFTAKSCWKDMASHGHRMSLHALLFCAMMWVWSLIYPVIRLFDMRSPGQSTSPYGEAGEDESRRIIGYLNIKWFMQTLLDRMDRTSMYSELEARVPFADHRIIEYVFNVPWHMKYQNGVEKTLLRDAFSDVLPPELLHRKKSPYPKTYHPGYEALLIKGMEEILDSPNAPVRTLIELTKRANF